MLSSFNITFYEITNYTHFRFIVLIETAITKWTTPSINSASGTATQNVAENKALNEVIVTFVAESDGSGEAYSLETTGTPFAVSTDGKLTITSSLDHETQETYTIEVKYVEN